MKWIVIWFVLNNWIVPCGQPDQYGRAFESSTGTFMVCSEDETTRMTKEFESYEAALRFMIRAEIECSECSEFKLESERHAVD